MRQLEKTDFWHSYNKDKDELAREARTFFMAMFDKYRDRDIHSRDIELALSDQLHSTASSNRGLEERNTAS